MNLKTIYNKITKDIHAVSPVVATLVLIVVAIIGAAAVGAMTGAFTDEVGEQEADVGVTGGSLIIGGSTTVEPVAREIAKGFMEANPGVRIIVQGGGTGAGISAVGRDVIDIGMASRDLRPAETVDYPALVGRVVKIGESTVLLVANRNINQTALNTTLTSDLYLLFASGIIPQNLSNIGVTEGVFRSDRSGTGDEFAEEIVGIEEDGHDIIHRAAAAHPDNLTLAAGNAGVFARIRVTEGAIGGIDLGFADEAYVTRSTEDHLREERPLNMITHGEPSRLEQAFFDYARSPGAIPHFTRVGVFSIVA